jgi:flavin-dependent dehydrogenase
MRRRERSASTSDVVIIGAGPAGATAAALLASWGWTVTLLHDGGGAKLAESIPAGTRSLFQFLRQLQTIDQAHFYPNRGNVSAWAGQRNTTTTEADGYHVPRQTFDRLLRTSAVDAGARLVRGKVVAVSGDDPFRVVTTGSSGASTVHQARYVLDCSGRAGVSLRHAGFERHSPPYRTLAIVADWDCDAHWPADESAFTVVESFEDGWAWSVPLSPRRRQCTVMVDPASRERAPGLAPAYARELGKAGAIAGYLKGARRIGVPWACNASPYETVPAGRPGLLLVGDAAAFVDPLSSGGVRKALLSAWRAAVVVNTSLGKAHLAEAAVDFYNRRERIVAAAHRRQAAAFFRQALDAHGHAFWAPRADPGEALPVGYGFEVTEADLAADPGVRPAFERLRDSQPFELRPASALAFAQVPVVDDREVVLAPALAVPHLGCRVRFAAGVDLPLLVDLAPQAPDLPALAGAYEGRRGAVGLNRLVGALAWLVAHGLLVMASRRSRQRSHEGMRTGAVDRAPTLK